MSVKISIAYLQNNTLKAFTRSKLLCTQVKILLLLFTGELRLIVLQILCAFLCQQEILEIQAEMGKVYLIAARNS